MWALICFLHVIATRLGIGATSQIYLMKESLQVDITPTPTRTYIASASSQKNPSTHMKSFPVCGAVPLGVVEVQHVEACLENRSSRLGPCAAIS